MKLEPRGKYAGIKIHLDGDEVQSLLLSQLKGWNPKLLVPPAGTKFAQIFIPKLVGKIMDLQTKYPDLLVDKSTEVVEQVLKDEAAKAAHKLEALKLGGDWQHAK